MLLFIEARIVVLLLLMLRQSFACRIDSVRFLMWLLKRQIDDLAVAYTRSVMVHLCLTLSLYLRRLSLWLLLLDSKCWWLAEIILLL